MANSLRTDIPFTYFIDGLQQCNRFLGRGSFGAVFEGHWRGTKVAIKRHHYMLVRDEADQLTEPYMRFLEEFPILKKCPHPNIVQVFGMARSTMPQDTPGLVMEYLPMTLRKRYDELPLLSRLDESTISLGVASGLAYLHSRQVVHRDLTTNNIMICAAAGTAGEVTAKVTDVGSAAVLGDGVVAQTMSMNPGAQTYMAPETQRPSGDTGHAKYGSPADCYSYAVSIMSMCNRREPPDLVSVVRDGRAGDVESLGEDHPLRDVVVRCLETDPERRPTACALCCEIAAVQAQLRSAAEPVQSVLVRADQELATARNEIVALRKRLTAGHVQCAQIVAERDVLLATRDRLSVEQARLGVEGIGVRQSLEGVRQDIDGVLRRRVAEHEEYTGRVATARQDADTKRRIARGLEESAETQRCGLSLDTAHLRRHEACFEALVSVHSEIGMQARFGLTMCPGVVAGNLRAAPKWTRLGEPPNRRKIGVGTCVFKGRVHITSFSDLNDQGSEMQGWSAPVMDLRKDTWSLIDLPDGSASGHIGGSPDQFFFTHRGDLYFINGRRFASTPQSIWKRKLQRKGWEKVAELPDARSNFGLAVVDGCLVLAGGAVHGGMPARPSVISLELAEHGSPWIAWHSWPEAVDKYTSARQFPNVLVWDGMILIVGGEDGGDQRCPVLTADLSRPIRERVWSTSLIPPPPKPRSAVVAVNSALVACEGFARPGRDNRTFMFYPGCTSWLQLPGLPGSVAEDVHRPSVLATDLGVLVVSMSGVVGLLTPGQ